MIESFLASWSLFHNTYITGWFLAALLSLVGVVVVARDQIFLGLAVSQASLLGVALGMWLASALPHEPASTLPSELWLSLWSISFGAMAAFLTSRPWGFGRESSEAITGWVYATAASVAVLVLSRSPHGLEEVHRLLSSTIIGASATDVVTFGFLLLLTVVAAARWYEAITLLVMDADMAGAVGLAVRPCNAVLSLWAAFAIGLSIRVSGLLFTFGSLILPALIAKNVVPEVRAMFWAAPLIALATTLCAFVLANYYDLPPGQVAVALQGLSLACAWLLRRRE